MKRRQILLIKLLVAMVMITILAATSLTKTATAQPVDRAKAEDSETMKAQATDKASLEQRLEQIFNRAQTLLQAGRQAELDTVLPQQKFEEIQQLVQAGQHEKAKEMIDEAVAGLDKLEAKGGKKGDEVTEPTIKPAPGKTHYSCYAIHLEPNEANDRFFGNLIEFMQLADKYKTKITLQFTPQWAEMILADETKLKLVKEWQKNGHEIAGHHHGAHHGIVWDGHTNLPEEQWRKARADAHSGAGFPNGVVPDWLKPFHQQEKYRGNMDNYVVLLNKLAAPNTIKTITMGPDRDTDWPASVPYSIEGIFDPSTSRPVLKKYSGNDVYELSMRFLQDRKAMETAKKEYLEAPPDDVSVVVLHILEYLQAPDVTEDWYKFLREKDPETIYSQTPARIMDRYTKKLSK